MNRSDMIKTITRFKKKVITRFKKKVATSHQNGCMKKGWPKPNKTHAPTQEYRPRPK